MGRSEMPKATDGNLWGFQLWVRQVSCVRQEGPLLVGLSPEPGGYAVLPSKHAGVADVSLWSTWQPQHKGIRKELHAASRFSIDDIVTSLKPLCALCAQVNLPAKDKMVKPRCAVGQVRCLQACPINLHGDCAEHWHAAS